MSKEKVVLDLKNILKFSSESVDKIVLFHEELLKFNSKYNLISESTENDIWNRHILDSAQLVKYINFEGIKSLFFADRS